MTMIAAWPVASRDRIVHAFKPGATAGAEAPFRTLRRHEWVSRGVRVTRFAERGFAGQLTFFSSLNVAAARLARQDKAPAATLVARAAADVEAGPEFADLRNLLAELPNQEAERVVNGQLPDDAPRALTEALRAVASRTEQMRAAYGNLSPAEVIFAGRIAEVSSTFVLIEAKNHSTMVPRWMADAARRDQVGAFLALVTDRLDDASAVMEAVPAIDVDIDVAYPAPDVVIAEWTHGFSPFGRDNARTRNITADDARLLTGEPSPLRILVPVTIEG